MEMYKLNSKLEDFLCGTVELKQVLAELQIISANAKVKYKDETEAIPATQIIVSRNETDFLRVECHSEKEVHFSSDRLIYKMGWFKKLFAVPYMQFRSPIDNAPEIIKNYFESSRESFENTYAISYANKESLRYVEVSV